MPGKGYLGLMGFSAAAAFTVAALVMLTLPPVVLGPLGVTLWFLVVLVAFTCIGAAAAFIAEYRIHPNQPLMKTLKRNATRRGLMIGGFITVLLALSSLKQLNVRDALLLALLLGLVEFYTVARS